MIRFIFLYLLLFLLLSSVINILDQKRGFGFIKVSDLETCNKILEQKEHVIRDKIVEFKPAFSKQDLFLNLHRIKDHRLVLKGLLKNTDQNALKDYFSSFGKVIDLRILYQN